MTTQETITTEATAKALELGWEKMLYVISFKYKTIKRYYARTDFYGNNDKMKVSENTYSETTGSTINVSPENEAKFNKAVTRLQAKAV